MSGRTWNFGDGIDTDVMAPGNYMKLPLAQLAAHCLEQVRPEFAVGMREGDVVVAGRNFGVGYSREQAAQALKSLGVHAVVAKSVRRHFLSQRPEPRPDRARVRGDVDPVGGRLELAQQGLVLPCEPVPGFLLQMVEDGGLLPHLKTRRTSPMGPTTSRRATR